MACFIVIHADNKNEKLQIISNFDDNLKYTVTSDLKDYVAKLYKVRIVEEEVVVRTVKNDQIIAKETSRTNNKVPPSTDTSRDATPLSSDSTQMAVIESVGVNTNFVRRVIKSDPTIESEAPSTNNIITPSTDTNINITPWCTQSSTNNDTIGQNESYGTNIPYRSRMIVPKKEIIDITMDSSMEEGITNDTGALSIDDVLVPSISNQQSIALSVVKSQALDKSSTSMRRGLVRSVKRPRYTTDDEESNEESELHKEISESRQQQTPKKQKRVDDSSNGSDMNTTSTSTRRSSVRSVKRPRYAEYDENGKYDCQASAKVGPKFKKQSESADRKGIECNMCSKQLNPEYRKHSKAKNHAIMHTDIKRFECPVEECNYKSAIVDTMIHHVRSKHPGISLPARKIELSSEQEKKLDETVRKCFPIFEKRFPCVD